MKGIQVILLLLFTLFLIPSMFAVDLYADATFIVLDTGDVQVTSVSNSPLFEERTTQQFTSKDGKIWSLNISDTQLYADMYYEVSLPQNAEINYLQSSVSSRFYVEDGIPKVKGFGTNDSFEVFVQYELISQNNEGLPSGFLVFAFVILIVAFMIFLYFYNFTRIKKNDVVTTKAHPVVAKSQLSKATLHLEKRQQDIMELLQRRGKLTQKQLSDYLSLPKSSIFRNIRSLEQKGLVKKERMGMSTIISVLSSKSDEKK